MADIKSQLKDLRMAPRKVRAVCDLVKGKNVLDAVAQLEVLVKHPVLPVLKLVKSAIANAENNHNMVVENLYIKSIRADEGVKLKRFKPKGFGRVSPIEKKTSHVRLILSERVPGLKKASHSVKKSEEKNVSSLEEQHRHTDKKPEIKTELGRKEGVLGNIGRRIFQRKSV